MACDVGNPSTEFSHGKSLGRLRRWELEGVGR